MLLFVFHDIRENMTGPKESVTQTEHRSIPSRLKNFLRNSEVLHVLVGDVVVL